MSASDLFPFVHRGLKVRGEYSAAADAWTAHFDLPPREGSFQSVIHTHMARPTGPAFVQRSTPEAAQAAAISEIDEYLDRK